MRGLGAAIPQLVRLFDENSFESGTTSSGMGTRIPPIFGGGPHDNLPFKVWQGWEGGFVLMVGGWPRWAPQMRVGGRLPTVRVI